MIQTDSRYMSKREHRESHAGDSPFAVEPRREVLERVATVQRLFEYSCRYHHEEACCKWQRQEQKREGRIATQDCGITVRIRSNRLSSDLPALDEDDNARLWTPP